MAKLFLESTDTSYKVSNSNTQIFGATGDQAVVIDGSLTGIVLNSNVERVQFTGSTTDYIYKVVGTDLNVYTAAGVLVTTVGVQDDATGTKLTFANGTVDAKITGLNAATVGGQAVNTAAPTAVAIPATAIDTTLASAPAPVFSVSAPVTSVTEAAGAVVSYTISLNAAQPAASSVSFALGNVGAATTADYGTAALTAVTGGATLAGSVITFPAGITTATITVPVTVDALTETGEGVSLTLSTPSTGATVSTTAGTASVSIIDPPTPVFSLTTSAVAVGEGTPAVGTTAAVAAGTITLTVTRSGNTAGTDSVVVQATGGTGTNGAISGSDFVALSQTVTFAPTETTKTVTFTTVADSTREGDETLTVALGTPSTGSSISTAAGASSVTLTITNDDPNLLPVITTPTTTPSAFIGSSTAVTGVSFTDGDDNTGFTVTVQAAGSSQVSFTITGSVTAKNSANTPMSTGETANTIVLSGTKTDLNTVLGTLKYTTNSTVPTSEQVVITITDSAGGTATKTLPINIGTSNTLTSGNDSFLGSAGDDEFSGTAANLATTDTINGGNGADKLVLTAVGTTNATVTGVISNIETLDLTLTANSTVPVTAANFGSALTTVNTTGDFTLGGTFNSGTVFNIAAATSVAGNGLTVTNLLVPSTSVASTVLTDAITVNLVNTLAAATATLTSITDTATTIDVLNINSNGAVANTIGTIGALATNATINIGGTQALTITTLPSLGTTGKIDATNASGKITLTTNAAATTVIGGSAGDSLLGAGGADSISGGAGNDTINGGAANDTITGGTGQDSLTGGTGVNTFVFTTGDSSSTTTRDTITDLKENDIIKFGGYGITGLTTGQTIATSASSATVKEVYIDATNSRIVIETAVDGSTKEEIAIPASVASASYTYNYGADSVVGTADDYITVGAAPFTATNNALGTLTLTGKAIATVAVVLSDAAPTVGSNPVGNNAVRTVTATTVTNAGISVTGSTGNDTITGTAQADTIAAGVGADSLTGGTGADTFVFANTSTGTPTTTNFDIITDYATTSDIIDFGATTLTLVAEGTIGVAQAAISATGFATFNAADDTFAERLIAVEAAMTAATAVAGETALFYDAVGAKSYVFISDGTAGVGATDVLIQIVGITATTGLTITGGDITAIA